MSLFTTVRPALFTIDPERAHRLTVATLKALPGRSVDHDRRLETLVGGLRLPSPIGLAAGFDKDAEVPGAMLSLGFGFVEVGTVTPQPQRGNAQPRLFRLVADGGVINRLGFNNGGQAAARERLARLRRTGPIGVNIGANKDSPNRIADYAAGVRAMAPVADWLTVNVSSPNTPGLRDLQSGSELVDLLAAVGAAREPSGPPVWLKVAPDLDDAQVAAVVEAAIASGIDAIVIGNTTISRPPLASAHRGEVGGLSGAPLRMLARSRLAAFVSAGSGRLPIVAAGGIDSAEEAYGRLRAGAAAVQLYSALVFAGPGLARQMANGLVALMTRDGFASVAALGASPASDSYPTPTA